MYRKYHSKCEQEIQQIDAYYIMMIFNYYIDKGIFTQEDIKHFIRNPNSKKYEIIYKLSKAELRSIWLYQIRHGTLFCEVCGQKIEECKGKSPKRLTAEHRIPQSKGGKTNVFNLGPAHSVCNCVKSNYMPDEWTKIGAYILNKYRIKIDYEKCRYNYERVR